MANGGFGDLNEVVSRAFGGFKIPSPEKLATALVAVGLIHSEFPETMKQKLEEEFAYYYSTGNCNSSTKNAGAALNPTLLESKTNKWFVRLTMCPFASYFPMPLNELEIDAQEGVATRYCQKVLKNLIVEYRRKQKTIDFHFHSSDDLQFCLSNTEDKFDVIDSATLADNVGLANLILSAIQKLEHHPDNDSFCSFHNSETPVETLHNLYHYLDCLFILP